MIKQKSGTKNQLQNKLKMYRKGLNNGSCLQMVQFVDLYSHEAVFNQYILDIGFFVGKVSSSFSLSNLNKINFFVLI